MSYGILIIIRDWKGRWELPVNQNLVKLWSITWKVIMVLFSLQWYCKCQLVTFDFHSHEATEQKGKVPFPTTVYPTPSSSSKCRNGSTICIGGGGEGRGCDPVILPWKGRNSVYSLSKLPFLELTARTGTAAPALFWLIRKIQNTTAISRGKLRQQLSCDQNKPTALFIVAFLISELETQIQVRLGQHHFWTYHSNKTSS